MYWDHVVLVIVLLAFLIPAAQVAGLAPASQPASQPATRPTASHPAASQPVARVVKQGQPMEMPGWTITVLSSSYYLAKMLGDTSGKERMFVTAEVRFTNTGRKHAYTPPTMVEDANHNRFTVGGYIGNYVPTGNHLTRKITFDVPSRRQLRLAFVDADEKPWWIGLAPKLQVER